VPSPNESPHVSVGSIANWVTSTAAGSLTTRFLSLPALVDQPRFWDWSTAALGPQPYPAYSLPLEEAIVAPPLVAAQSRRTTGSNVSVAPPLTASDTTGPSQPPPPALTFR